MATPTYTAIASITLGSSASSVTFSSIPQDYRDLVLVFNGTTSTAATAKVLSLSPNGSGNSGSVVGMFGNGSSAVSETDTDLRIGRLPGSGGIGTTISQIMDYSATDKHKTILWRSSGDSSAQDKPVYAAAARWPNTTAISSLVLTELTGTDFASGSTFALWGIAS